MLDCDMCEISFARKFTLLRHIVREHGKKERHRCKRCKRIFTAKDNLKSHFQSVHQKIKTHKCYKCPRVFAKASNLKRHIENHLGYGKVCDKCDKKWPNQNFNRHVANCRGFDYKAFILFGCLR